MLSYYSRCISTEVALNMSPLLQMNLQMTSPLQTHLQTSSLLQTYLQTSSQAVPYRKVPISDKCEWMSSTKSSSHHCRHSNMFEWRSSTKSSPHHSRSSLLWPGVPKGESNLVNYHLLAVMLLKQHNGQHLCAVDHNRLRTMATETVDSIDSITKIN